jgi:hypothetical protein
MQTFDRRATILARDTRTVLVAKAKSKAPTRVSRPKRRAKTKPAVKAQPRRGSAAKKAPVAALTTVEKARLLKPLSNFEELVTNLVKNWRAHGREIRVPGLTPAALAAKLRRARRASDMEEALRTRLETRLQPLADKRLRTEHDVWKSALDLHAMIKAAARTNPAIATPFQEFAEALTRKRAGNDDAAPSGPETQG